MSLYEEHFDTDWTELEIDEAADRAYAIGVAERLGEENREELEKLYAEVETGYGKQMVELAYDEGRSEAAEAAPRKDSPENLWDDLVEGGERDLWDRERPTGGRNGLPQALDPSEVLSSRDFDTTEAVKKPGFLEK